jgi:hypothetical protein
MPVGIIAVDDARRRIDATAVGALSGAGVLTHVARTLGVG